MNGRANSAIDLSAVQSADQAKRRAIAGR